MMHLSNIYYMLQQTIASTHFPTKLERLTNKVAKLLSQKYKLQGSTKNIAQQHLHKDIKISTRDIQNAVQKSIKMTSKLKLIRTLLGYQNQSTKKQKKVTKIESQQKQTEQKGVNLKQFVMSMRKKNQITDNYFKHRKTNSISSPQQTFDQQSKNIQQYTDASLKYVHSFLPHQTTLSTLDQISFKRKKSVQKFYQPLSNLGDHQFLQKDRSYETIQDQYDQSSALLERQQLFLMKSKRSLNVSTYNANSPQYRRFQDHNTTIKQQAERIQRITHIYRKQSISLPSVKNQQTIQRQKDSKLTNITTPLVHELGYKGKYYHKQLKNSLKNNNSQQKTVYIKQKQQNKPIKELFPMIKQCIPMNRPKQSNAPA